MLKKLVLLAVIAVVMVAGLGAGLVSADDSSEDGNVCLIATDAAGLVATFCDGRLNGTDMDAPVAIYYQTQEMQVLNDDDEYEWQNVITGVEVWRSIPKTAQGHLVLSVPLSQISSAMASPADVQIAQQNGYSLNYSPSADALWVTAPNGYSFAWEIEW